MNCVNMRYVIRLLLKTSPNNHMGKPFKNKCYQIKHIPVRWNIQYCRESLRER